MDILFTSSALGPMRVKNRTVRSATNEHLATPTGGLTEEWVAAIETLAQGEVGLIIPGQVSVDPRHRGDEGQAVVDEGVDRALLAKAAQAVHHYGGSIVIQLSHCGIKGGACNPVPPKHPQDFSLEELEELVERFTAAARLCQEAGMDGVQVHTAHGYLLSNFLNPAENLRTDDYGGSLENRFRLPGRIIRSIRSACGEEFALLVKADSNGCGDLPGLMALYEAAGVDGVELSGVNFAAFKGKKTPFFLPELKVALEATRLPLILTGGIFSRAGAEEALEAGASFVGFSRALLCEPDFVERLKSGGAAESKCLACNGCYQVFRRKAVRCVQHTAPIPRLQETFGGGA